MFWKPCLSVLQGLFSGHVYILKWPLTYCPKCQRCKRSVFVKIQAGFCGVIFDRHKACAAPKYRVIFKPEVMWSRRYEKLCNVMNLWLTSSPGLDQRETGQLWRLEQSSLIICAKNERYICYDAFTFISRLHHCLFTTHCCTREDFLYKNKFVFQKMCVLFKYEAFFKCYITQHLFRPALSFSLFQ